MTEKRFENRLNKSKIKFNTLNPVWDNEKEDALNVFEMIDLLNQLNDENEQLKQALRDYYNAFDCSQCRYHNYDWYDDGDEFEVCDKGNNEAQMDYHSCKDWEELQ